MDRSGPLIEAFNKLPDGVIRQELTSYYMRDGRLVKETVERVYDSKGDYTDGTHIVPLTK